MITDIHAHILPGIDDGPENLNESHKLLNAFRESGTNRVFCTSHLLSPHFDVSCDELQQAFDTLTEQHRSNEPLLALGSELRLAPEFTDYLKDERIPTLGKTNYLLVEFRSNQISQRALGLIHELVIRGYVPVMAHPERNIAIQKSPKLLADLANEGVLFQLTAQCFTRSGRNAHVADKLAWKIIQDGMCTVIASDAHNTTTRLPGLLDAYDEIAARLGQQTTDQLIHNANAIWDGQQTELVIPKKRRWLTSLLH